MPTIKSAIKRVEVAERNHNRNKSWRTSVRTVQNVVADSVKAGNKKAADEALERAYKVIDMAVSKGILHINAAARRKSRLAKAALQTSKSRK